MQRFVVSQVKSICGGLVKSLHEIQTCYDLRTIRSCYTSSACPCRHGPYVRDPFCYRWFEAWTSWAELGESAVNFLTAGGTPQSFYISEQSQTCSKTLVCPTVSTIYDEMAELSSTMRMPNDLPRNPHPPETETAKPSEGGPRVCFSNRIMALILLGAH